MVQYAGSRYLLEADPSSLARGVLVRHCSVSIGDVGAYISPIEMYQDSNADMWGPACQSTVDTSYHGEQS